ncbi:hypothetical protein AMTRI_Chr07g28770 [Amborella trichopoda]|uniref:Uncharacterized protein n=1 Tax=Amborella trichopoda TaxID=13333 RepID=W1PAQ0_AMBTC|nr:uncharacterized protein LOC110007149 [Amborella trichopoda]ERN04754.1 hypothetical protein AMTR_s00140p00019120 [Amborella trichopoda]|eukprot:XP_020522129.1 uncharacterized protein LOC110007149 [Amborella trichopoda]
MASEQASSSNTNEGGEGVGTSEITEVESETENNNNHESWTLIPVNLEWMGAKEMADGKFTAVVYNENTPSLQEKLVLKTFHTREEAARAQEESIGKHPNAYEHALMVNLMWRMEEEGADEAGISSTTQEREEGEGRGEITEVVRETGNNRKEKRWKQLPNNWNWLDVKETADGKFATAVAVETSHSKLTLVRKSFDTREQAVRAHEGSYSRHGTDFDDALIIDRQCVWVDEREKKGLFQGFKDSFKKMMVCESKKYKEKQD